MILYENHPEWAYRWTLTIVPFLTCFATVGFLLVVYTLVDRRRFKLLLKSGQKINKTV